MRSSPNALGKILGANGLPDDAGIGISVYADASLDDKFLVFRKGGKPFQSAVQSWLP